MRAFFFRSDRQSPKPGARSALALAGLIGLATPLIPLTPLNAQYPGELAGRVTDALTGDGVEGALVEVVGTGHTTLTAGDGTFALRGLEPGDFTIRVGRLGYLTAQRTVSIRNGQRARLDIALGVDPIAVEGIQTEGAADGEPGVIRITRAQIESSGARDLAEALEGRAGLTLIGGGPGAAQTVSIRGSGDDDVLVLLDGAPLNDPITGAADLSSVPASQIESITVVKGAAGARFGSGAQAGVIAIETRSDPQPTRLLVGSGSLGSWRAEGDVSLGPAPFDLVAGADASGQDGRFDFRSASLESGGDTRGNADVLELGGFVAGRGAVADGELRVRSGYTRMERGLPGTSFQQSPHAREVLDRWRGQAGWDRVWGDVRLALDAHAVHQAARFRDPAPPVGLPYDSRTTATSVGGDLLLELDAGARLRSLLFGLDFDGQRYESSELDESAPGGRIDVGAFVGGRLLSGAPPWPELVAILRVDRDGDAGVWRLTHELTARAEIAFLDLHVGHASSYDPPDFGDQYFKDGVAVQPNPDLRAERVPSEISGGLGLEGGLPLGARGRLTVEAYRADVRDMIIWAPDFRFVWSPRNFDVKRRGLELGGSLRFPRQSAELAASYAYTWAVYDRAGDTDTVQLVYRPRHRATARLAWNPGAWSARIEADYTGTRYPVPAPVNALDPFWTIALRAARRFRVGGWEATPALRVDRLLDNHDSLIFGYPEPGRTYQIELTLRRLR